MIEILLVGVVMLFFKGYKSKVVIDAGDDMPYFIATSLRQAGVIPYEVPISEIMKGMVVGDKRRLTPNWIDVYVK